MPPTAAETREAILRNARAAERARLRNLARAQFPHLDDEQLDAKVRELDHEKLARAGRAGRRRQQHNADVGKTWLLLEDDLVGRIEDILHIARMIAAANTEPRSDDTDEAAA